jgi:hypothetical protein
MAVMGEGNGVRLPNVGFGWKLMMLGRETDGDAESS